jgi:N-acyl-D-amino-acid deacylase
MIRASTRTLAVRPFTLLVLFLLAGCVSAPPAPTKHADLLVRNGRIVDGTGNSWFEGDVAIAGGRIAAVGNLEAFTATRVIDAQRRIVAPGFIDVHAHIETSIFTTPSADNYVHDGVTTVITGNCGGSADSLREYFDKIAATGTSINVAALIGHNTVRRLTMGMINRAPTPEEQRRMEALVEQGMKDGAVGFSTGLIYLPGMFSGTDEVAGLAVAARRHGGVYASHIRNESDMVVAAINEAIDIGKRARIPVQISHFKVGGNANWGRSKETLAIVEGARRDGWDVTIDQYPYTASSSQLSVLLPDAMLDGGLAAARKRLADPAQRAAAVEAMVKRARQLGRPDFGYAVIARHAADPSLNGKSVAEVNRMRGRPATMEQEAQTIVDLILAGSAQMVFHGMDEADVRHIMRYPFSMIAADGGIQDGTGLPHPRSYGTNARVLGKYVREEGLVSLEEAVRRMTSLPAQRFQLKDRGMLREGFAADLVVFDPATVADRATYDKPHQFAVGIETVVVNGRLVVDGGRHTGTRSGTPLKGPGASR